MKPKVTIIKHLCKRQSNELGATRYHAHCGASGLTRREYVNDIASVSCVKCWAQVRARRMPIRQAVDLDTPPAKVYPPAEPMNTERMNR